MIGAKWEGAGAGHALGLPRFGAGGRRGGGAPPLTRPALRLRPQARTEDEQLAEERRLMHVALTRARVGYGAPSP